MRMFRFDKDFPWWGKNPNCKLCALALFMFKRRDYPIDDVPEDARRDAVAAGIGREVNYEAMQQ